MVITLGSCPKDISSNLISVKLVFKNGKNKVVFSFVLKKIYRI
jgi:hypothetical protein